MQPLIKDTNPQWGWATGLGFAAWLPFTANAVSGGYQWAVTEGLADTIAFAGTPSFTVGIGLGIVLHLVRLGLFVLLMEAIIEGIQIIAKAIRDRKSVSPTLEEVKA